MKAILTVIFLLCLSGPAFAQEYDGKAIGITDGDTFTLLTPDHNQYKIRLAEIDTPEKAQPYGQKAKQELSDLIFGQDVQVIKTDTDRYGRIVGKVYKGQLYVNAAMVKAGAAWVYREYAKDQSLYVLEEMAKEKEVGLWKMPEAQITPPWEWRKLQKKHAEMKGRVPDASNNNGGYTRIIAPPPRDYAAKPSPSQPSKTRTFSCGSKKYCKQMSSCDEARFYLTQCGLSRLDGDDDGVPCESLCR